MTFAFEPQRIPEIVRVRVERHVDDRGFFSEIFRESAFREAGIRARFVQDNLTRSGRGVLRGLHFQLPPAAQGKLVGPLRGTIFDVAVDLRRAAPTYGQWVGATLEADKGDFLWIPEGFAHGYCVLSDGADVAYKVTAEYDPALDRGFAWNDPAVGIRWPLTDPVLSDRDQSLPALSETEHSFVV